MNIYDFTMKNYLGEMVSLSEYQGKVLLVVNTATRCGLTPQYTALEALYEKYKDKGLVVLDFPSNQFLDQTPGTDEEIHEFCTLTYDTKFPRFSKISINGDDTAPLYQWLKEQAPEDKEDKDSLEFEAKVKQYTPDIGPADIKWNFCKFLIDRNGNVNSRYSPGIVPEKLAGDIEALL